MNSLVIYRVVTYILLFIAAFLAAGIITSIPAVLAAPGALMMLFLLGCIVIYSYCSWRFLINGIDKGTYMKPALRDLIRVNGYVTLAMGAILFVTIIIMSTQRGMIGIYIENLKQMQPEIEGKSEADLVKEVQFILRFLGAYSALLVAHTIVTFRLLKQHKDIFEEPADIED